MATTTQTTKTIQKYTVYIKATPQAIGDALTKPEWTVKYGYAPLVDYDSHRYAPPASRSIFRSGAGAAQIVRVSNAVAGRTPARPSWLTAWRGTVSTPLVAATPLADGRRPLRRGVLDASWAVMFVIELIYKADLAEIDAHMTAHVRFLKKYYALGNFLVSGRKIPRDGGIILAVGNSRREIETIIQEDPFYARGLADFRIIEFRASQRADDIQKRIER